MFFSKSFGYALRGILYIAMMSDEKKRVQIDEIAERLSVPKHFLGKILNKIVKEGILDSTKGPYGGFSINQNTLSTPLIKVLEVTEGLEQFTVCAMRLRKCNSANPCPVHPHIDEFRGKLKITFTETTINNLLTENKSGLIRSIATL